MRKRHIKWKIIAKGYPLMRKCCSRNAQSSGKDELLRSKRSDAIDNHEKKTNSETKITQLTEATATKIHGQTGTGEVSGRLKYIRFDTPKRPFPFLRCVGSRLESSHHFSISSVRQCDGGAIQRNLLAPEIAIVVAPWGGIIPKKFSKLHVTEIPMLLFFSSQKTFPLVRVIGGTRRLAGGVDAEQD
nr:hypothetical protein Iba_chr03cCG6100 [Ipomoea batatas]